MEERGTEREGGQLLPISIISNVSRVAGPRGPTGLASAGRYLPCFPTPPSLLALPASPPSSSSCSADWAASCPAASSCSRQRPPPSLARAGPSPVREWSPSFAVVSGIAAAPPTPSTQVSALPCGEKPARPTCATSRSVAAEGFNKTGRLPSTVTTGTPGFSARRFISLGSTVAIT